MIYYQNECVHCGKPCMKGACPYFKVTHSRCDECGEEDVKLYQYDGFQLCLDCIKNSLIVVEGSEDFEDNE